jgi:dihydroorotate dehydrogenase
LREVQEARAAAEKRPPLLVKLAPDIADSDIPEIVSVIQAHAVDGIVVSNTTLSRDGLEDRAFAAETEGSPAGRYSRAPRACSPRCTNSRRKLPVIGVGGIDSGAAAVAKIRAGASLLQLYTGLVFEGPKLIGDIKLALLAAMQEAKTESLGSLVGRDADQWADKPLPNADS